MSEDDRVNGFLAVVAMATGLLLSGWLGGFGEALLPEPWRGGVTGVLTFVCLAAFLGFASGRSRGPR